MTKRRLVHTGYCLVSDTLPQSAAIELVRFLGNLYVEVEVDHEDDDRPRSEKHQAPGNQNDQALPEPLPEKVDWSKHRTGGEE
jgi:hypothetical protein